MSDTISFRSFLEMSSTPFWEVIDIASMSTDDVNFEPIDSDNPNEDFDEEDVRSDCERQVERSFYSSDYYDGIYDEPEEDPSFKTLTVDVWEKDNPMPDEENEEEFAVWQQERDEVELEYDNEVSAWRKEMQKARNDADEAESEARWEAISDCVEEKRREWEEENANRIPGFENNGGYKSKFRIGGDAFEVGMDRVDDLKYEGQTVHPSFSITFSGPSRFSTTNKAGSGASTIYTQLLLAVKKLTETEKVNGLTFYPAEPGMGLVYQRFYKQYLKAEFLRVSPKEYVRKDYIQEILAGKSQGKKNLAYSQILGNERRVRTALKQASDMKNDVRLKKLRGMKLVGRVVVMKDEPNEPVYVYDIDVSPSYGRAPSVKAKVAYVDENGYASAADLELHDIIEKEPPVNKVQALFTAITKRQDLLSKIDGPQFRSAMGRFMQSPTLGNAQAVIQQGAMQMKQPIPDVTDVGV